MERRRKAAIAFYVCAGLARLAIYWSVDGMSAVTVDSVIATWIAGILSLAAISIAAIFRLWK